MLRLHKALKGCTKSSCKKGIWCLSWALFAPRIAVEIYFFFPFLAASGCVVAALPSQDTSKMRLVDRSNAFSGTPLKKGFVPQSLSPFSVVPDCSGKRCCLIYRLRLVFLQILLLPWTYFLSCYCSPGLTSDLCHSNKWKGVFGDSGSLA